VAIHSPKDFYSAVTGKTGPVQVNLSEGLEENVTRTIGPGT